MSRLRLARLLALGLLLGGGSTVAQPAAWLDGDPAAIWQRPPGFYQDGQSWYAIAHTRPKTVRVRLAGDFTGGAVGAVDLTRTPDGKFWWWKGSADALARPPRAGDRYGFVVTHADGSETWTQDPAARRVESSDLSGAPFSYRAVDQHAFENRDHELLDAECLAGAVAADVERLDVVVAQPGTGPGGYVSRIAVERE